MFLKNRGFLDLSMTKDFLITSVIHELLLSDPLPRHNLLSTIVYIASDETRLANVYLLIIQIRKTKNISVTLFKLKIIYFQLNVIIKYIKYYNIYNKIIVN